MADNKGMMTKAEAINKARDRASRFGGAWSVIERTDHPAHPGKTVYMVCRTREIRQLSAGSRVVAEFAGGEGYTHA